MTENKTNALLPLVSERLHIPIERLAEWRSQKKISVQLINGGWKLTINGEPARTEITNAQMAQRNEDWGNNGMD
jgi:hypothetical protein